WRAAGPPRAPRRAASTAPPHWPCCHAYPTGRPGANQPVPAGGPLPAAPSPSPADRRLTSAPPVGDGTMPDVEHNHQVLAVDDLVQHPPFPAETGAVDAGQFGA